MDPLIRTNLEKPYARPDVTRRPRLMEALAAGLDKRLIMVVAPAGYGKTTLLAQWLHEAGLKAAWLSLDSERHDFTTFLAYFVAAIQSIDPRLGKRVQSLTKGAQMPPVTKLVGMLINELSELPRNAVFVLEDYHLVHDREVHELISALVSRWPQHILWSFPRAQTRPCRCRNGAGAAILPKFAPKRCASLTRRPRLF